jgi:hypothetical protein
VPRFTFTTNFIVFIIYVLMEKRLAAWCNGGVCCFILAATALRSWQRRTLSNEGLPARLSIRKMGTSFVIETRLLAVSAAVSSGATKS